MTHRFRISCVSIVMIALPLFGCEPRPRGLNDFVGAWSAEFSHRPLTQVVYGTIVFDSLATRPRPSRNHPPHCCISLGAGLVRVRQCDDAQPRRRPGRCSGLGASLPRLDTARIPRRNLSPAGNARLRGNAACPSRHRQRPALQSRFYLRSHHRQDGDGTRSGVVASRPGQPRRATRVAERRWIVGNGRSSQSRSRCSRARTAFAYLREDRGGRLPVVYRDTIVQEWYSPRYREPMYAMSSTKSIPAVLVGMLLDERRLGSVDDRVCTYIRSWCDGIRGHVSVRHLLSMTSGLPRMYANGVGYTSDKDEFVEDLIPTNEPGTSWAYSHEGAQRHARPSRYRCAHPAGSRFGGGSNADKAFCRRA